MKGWPIALREKASQRKVPGWLPAGVLRKASRPSIQPPVRWVRPPGRIRSMRSRTAGLFDTGPVGMTTSAASSKVMRAEGVFAAEVLHDDRGGAEGRGQGVASPGTAAVEHERKGNGLSEGSERSQEGRTGRRFGRAATGPALRGPPSRT